MKTGFDKLDNIIHDMKNDKILLIASRPGSGKTTLAIDITNNVAKETDKPVLYFSLESSKKYLEPRFLSDNIEIITGHPSITSIHLISEKMYRKYGGLSLIVVDYLQLIKSGISDETFDYTRKKIIEILHHIAVMLNVPVIVLSQLSSLDNEDYYLKIKDYSSYISNILLLYREVYDDQLKIKVIDNTGVSYGSVGLTFNEEMLSFEEIAE